MFSTDSQSHSGYIPQGYSQRLPMRRIPDDDEPSMYSGPHMKKRLDMLEEAIVLLTQLLKNSQKLKVVDPGKFKYESEQDLLVYLADFEAYCSLHYPNAHHQWLRLLGRQLEGKFLNIYREIIKDNREYFSVRDNLVCWYRDEERKKKEYRIQKYHAAHRYPNESIKMFALRLERLASQAYPGYDMRDHDSLRIAFLCSLPPYIETFVRQYIKMMELDGYSRAPWENIVNFADSLDSNNTAFPNSMSQTNPLEVGPSTYSRTDQVVDLNESVESVMQINAALPGWTDVLRKKVEQRKPKSSINLKHRSSNLGQRSPPERNNSSRIVYNTVRNSPPSNDRSRAQNNRK